MKVICVKCGEEKEHTALGLCKSCYDRHRYQENREAILAYHRRYHQEHREQELARMDRYQKENREKVLARKRRYYEEHREHCIAYAQRYRKENPDKRAEYMARRAARKRSVANTVTSEQLEFERKIGEAIYGGQKLHLHHLVPLSKGGGHTWGNIAFIPASLNMSVKDRLPEEVYVQVGMKIGGPGW